MNRPLSISLLKDCVQAVGGKWFWQDGRPWDFNLVIIRTANRRAGAFDDWLTLSYFDVRGESQLHYWPVTVDPGPYYLERPMHNQGTAVMAEGQHRGAWGLGIHHAGKPGAHPALVQVGPIKVHRDNNRDQFADITTPIVIAPVGSGINCHAAGEKGITQRVGKYSAACTVYECREEQELGVALVRIGFKHTGDKTISPTVIYESTYERVAKGKLEIVR